LPADGVVAGSQDRRGDRVTPGGARPLLRHVDRVRGRHGALHPYGPGAARRDGHVRPGLALELTARPVRTPERLTNAEERASVPDLAWVLGVVVLALAASYGSSRPLPSVLPEALSRMGRCVALGSVCRPLAGSHLTCPFGLPNPPGSCRVVYQAHVSRLSARALRPYPPGYEFPVPFGGWSSLLGPSCARCGVGRPS